MANYNTIKKTVGVKHLCGQWEIILLNCPVDKNDHCRLIMPTIVNYIGKQFKFLKPASNFSALYKELTQKEFIKDFDPKKPPTTPIGMTQLEAA